jgi:cellulose synthase/poly-beta-1,6-N-acetylglucosamine synthase-like glycosyltransferase
MGVLEFLGNVFQVTILMYFALINTFHAASLYMGALGMNRALRRGNVGIKDLLEREVYKPVSILVPAYNEQETIAASVNSFLNLHYPEFEVVVINDGSKDNTIEVLKETYDLVEIPKITRFEIKTSEIKAAYRSPKYPNMIVVDKANGGKADALNVGLIHSRYPLFCAVDADSLLEAKSLLRATRAFVEDDSIVAIGCTIRVLNGATLDRGVITELRAPSGWVERFQVLEYLRAFLVGRLMWGNLGMLLIISGAFGIFRRDMVLRLGGYRTDTVGEDMELAVRLHAAARATGKPYKILYTVDPICWTQVPSDWKTLRKQRNRWQRGLWETLINHKVMLLNPKYGRLGMVAIPYFWLLEALSPALEVGGYVYVIFSALAGQLNVPFATAFAALAILYGSLLSMAAIWAEGLLPTRYERLSDRLILLLASVVESVGYRQGLAWVRFHAGLTVSQQRGKWGSMVRKKI